MSRKNAENFHFEGSFDLGKNCGPLQTIVDVPWLEMVRARKFGTNVCVVAVIYFGVDPLHSREL